MESKNKVITDGRFPGKMRVRKWIREDDASEDAKEQIRRSIDHELQQAIYETVSDGRTYHIKVEPFDTRLLYHWRYDEIGIQRRAAVLLVESNDVEFEGEKWRWEALWVSESGGFGMRGNRDR